MRLKSPISILTFIGIVGHQQAWAVDACVSLRPDQALAGGQVFEVRSPQPVAPFGRTALPRPNGGGLRFAYVVQTGGNATGALIVKARHQLPEGANAKSSEGFPAGDMIQLSRSEYVSPCKKKIFKSWSQKVRLEHYVDQHFYGTNYPWKKEFHADSSYRVQPLMLGFTRGICKNTYDPETRPNFLYSENPMIATNAQALTRQAEIAASKTGLISAAFADTAEFYRYKLHTAIIPYDRRELASKNCVSFGLDVPKEAGSTRLEIIDSELGTRQSWQIQWKEFSQN